MSRRVVITGIGAVTPLGVGAHATWDALLDARTGIKRFTSFDPSGAFVPFAAFIDGFSARDHVPRAYRKALKVMARDTELAVVAARLAVDDARLVTKGTLEEGSTAPLTYAPARVGCQIGAGLIAAEVPELAAAMTTVATPGGGFDYGAWGERGMENLTPLWLLKYLPNMLACHVTIIHDAQGPSNTITCGEASGGLSIGESVRVIERMDADACFSGGAESKLNHMGIVRQQFARRTPLSPSLANADAGKLVRPYDPASVGIVGEGAGIVILEGLDTALARGARPYCEVLGLGAAQSFCSAGDYEPGGDGLRFAIENALDDASIRPDEIDAIIPQGAGAPSADASEAAALRAVFGKRLADIPLVTLTPAIGSTHAGEGGIQACIGALCLRHRMLPARLNSGTPLPGLNAAAAPARDAPLRRVLTCSSSIGGQNAALVLGAIDPRA